jgi:hypothetical protein
MNIFKGARPGIGVVRAMEQNSGYSRIKLLKEDIITSKDV